MGAKSSVLTREKGNALGHTGETEPVKRYILSLQVRKNVRRGLTSYGNLSLRNTEPSTWEIRRTIWMGQQIKKTLKREGEGILWGGLSGRAITRKLSMMVGGSHKKE